MTKIDFYILADNSNRCIENLACQLTEKAYKQNNFVYIQCQSVEQANQLDELLWKFKAESFLPHQHVSNSQPEHAENSGSTHTSDSGSHYSYPILINSSEIITPNYNPTNLTEVLINLSSKTPDFYSQFHRLVEIVDKDENSKQLARLRFSFYKDRAYDISTHHL